MNEFGEFDALRVALIDYYGNGKIGPLADHLPVGAEMVDSRYIRYQGLNGLTSGAGGWMCIMLQNHTMSKVIIKVASILQKRYRHRICQNVHVALWLLVPMKNLLISPKKRQTVSIRRLTKHE